MLPVSSVRQWLQVSCCRSSDSVIFRGPVRTRPNPRESRSNPAFLIKGCKEKFFNPYIEYPFLVIPWDNTIFHHYNLLEGITHPIE